MIALDDYARLIAAHGDMAQDYLRDHYPRFVATKQRWQSRRLAHRGKRLLDVGAHWLHQTLLYALDGFEASALDLPATLDLPQVRSLARAHSIALLPNANLEDPTALVDVADDTFDVVLFTEVIEHLAFNPVALWREIHRVAKPGASIIVTTPNYYALRTRLRQWSRSLRLLGGGVPAEQILQLRTLSHHWKEYSRRELLRYFALLSADFRVRSFSYTQEYLSTFRRRRGSSLVLGIERIVPPLRPDLYLELELSQKDAGVTLAPHW